MEKTFNWYISAKDWNKAHKTSVYFTLSFEWNILEVLVLYKRWDLHWKLDKQIKNWFLLNYQEFGNVTSL
jgi:hypothetical protein